MNQRDFSWLKFWVLNMFLTCTQQLQNDGSCDVIICLLSKELKDLLQLAGGKDRPYHLRHD